MDIGSRCIKVKILPNIVNKDKEGNKEGNNSKIYKNNKKLYNGSENNYNNPNNSLFTNYTLNILIYGEI